MGKIKKLSIALILLTIITRVIGFLREIIIAYIYGTSSIIEEYIIGQTIGEIIGNVILVTTFATFTLLMINDYNFRLEKIIFMGIYITLPLILFIITFSEQITNLLVFENSGLNFNNIVLNIKVIAPSLLFLTIAAIINSYLNYHNKYLVPLIGILVLNLSFIICLFLINIIFKSYSHISLSASYLISSIIYLIFTIILFRILKIQIRINESNKEIINIKTIYAGKILIVTLISTAIMKLNLITDRFFLNQDKLGQMAAYNYALKVFNLPIAIIGTALISLLFVNYLKTDIKIDYESKIFKIMSYLGVIMGVFIFVFSDSLINLIYGYGNFTVNDANHTSRYLRLLSPLIPLHMLILFYHKIIFDKIKGIKLSLLFSLFFMINLISNIILIYLLNIEPVISVITSTYITTIINILMFISVKIILINKIFIFKISITVFLLIITLELIENIYVSSGFILIIYGLIYIILILFIDKYFKFNIIKELIRLK